MFNPPTAHPEDSPYLAKNPSNPARKPALGRPCGEFYGTLTRFDVSGLAPNGASDVINGIVLLRLFILCLALVTSLPAEQSWAQLKVGMAADEALEVLGEPVSVRHGRGFETWIYDHGAEVLVYTVVVGWTAPSSSGLKSVSHDVWAAKPGGNYHKTLAAAVSKAVRANAPVPAKASVAVAPAAAGIGYEEYLRTQARPKV